MAAERATTYREFMTDAPDLTPNSEASDTTAAAEPPRQLRRSVNGKVIAGVARGLGNRFDIDANIFRVIFVILALFWGLGVAIYLAMWVFVPQAKGEELTARGRRPVSSSHRLTVALLVGVLVLAVLLILFARGGPLRNGAPSLALLWLVFLVALAVVAIRTPARRLTVRRFFAVIFLVALSGLILLVGALFGFLDSTGVSLQGGNGAHTWQPTALRDVQHRYTTEFGSTTVDLAAVTFPASGFFGIAVDPAVKVYTSESYPTEIRAWGVATTEGFGRLISGVIGPSMIPTLFSHFGVAGVYSLVGTIALVAVVVVALYGRETKGLPLEQSATAR